MGFLSRLRDTIKEGILRKRGREATKEFEKQKTGRGQVYGYIPPQSDRELDEIDDIITYVETGEFPEHGPRTYADETPRSFIPGPDPSSLRSGDLLTTAQFYGITDEEYETLEQLINTAYVDPASSESERRAAINEIQDAMSMLHNRARETGDFDWASWREEHYPKGSIVG